MFWSIFPRSTRSPRSRTALRTKRFSLYIHVIHWVKARPGNGGLSATHFAIDWYASGFASPASTCCHSRR